MAAEDRFWSRVDQSGGLDSCWPFMGARDPGGYGCINRTSYGEFMAHRFAAKQVVGAPQSPEAVMHECDNPPCCNPLHLTNGTRLLNNQQAWNRGLHPKGDRHSATRISDDQVEEIRARRAAGEKGADLAREYGVGASHISHIVTGRRRAA